MGLLLHYNRQGRKAEDLRSRGNTRTPRARKTGTNNRPPAPNASNNVTNAHFYVSPRISFSEARGPQPLATPVCLQPLPGGWHNHDVGLLLRFYLFRLRNSSYKETQWLGMHRQSETRAGNHRRRTRTRNACLPTQVNNTARLRKHRVPLQHTPFFGCKHGAKGLYGLLLHLFPPLRLFVSTLTSTD